MEINYLKEFVVLAQTGNFLEAADTLYSSQSTLSKHIKSMESELGVPLFDRTTRKVRISKYGQLLLPYAKQIIELHDEYTAILQTSLETDREILTVGSIHILAQYKITDIFAECSIDYDPKSNITQEFYATVQNKFHFAIHGQTAAELIISRANAEKVHMGLNTWKNAP